MVPFPHPAHIQHSKVFEGEHADAQKESCDFAFALDLSPPSHDKNNTHDYVKDVADEPDRWPRTPHQPPNARSLRYSESKGCDPKSWTA